MHNDSKLKEYVKMREDLSYPNRDAILLKLNTPKFNSSKDYKFIPESELWANRNKNYKYWI